jgi:CheY-like chemotaxis protein
MQLTPPDDLSALEQALALGRLHREMRVPLNTILGQVQMLQGGALDSDKVNARAQAIETAGLRMLDLLDGMLTAGSPLDGEHARLRPVALHELLLRHAPRETVVHQASEASAMVWADPGVMVRMLGVMGGLVTVAGLPWGRNALSWASAANNQVVLTFYAQWPEANAELDPLGVRLELLKRLADMQQLSLDSPQRGPQSLRLTLSLCRVVMDSDFDANRAALHAGSQDPAHGANAGARPDILLVEDDAANAEVITSFIGGRLGFSVRHVPDVASAIDALREHAPRLVLLDMYLPGDAGTVFLDHLRQRDPEHKIACIVLTSAAGRSVERKVRAMGADDYLDKPVRLEVLRQRVQHFMGQGETA